MAERFTAELRALPRAAVYAQVEAALTRQRERAEYSHGHAALVAAHDRLLLAHQPVSQEPDAACSDCGQLWPCGVVAGIVASG